MKKFLAASVTAVAMSVASMASAAVVTLFDSSLEAPGSSFGSFTLSDATTITIAVDVSASTPYQFGVVGDGFSATLFTLNDFGPQSYAVSAGTYFVNFAMFGSSAMGTLTVTYDDPTAAPVPLPAAAPLLLAAVGGLGIAARRKKKAA